MVLLVSQSKTKVDESAFEYCEEVRMVIIP